MSNDTPMTPDQMEMAAYLYLREFCRAASAGWEILYTGREYVVTIGGVADLSGRSKTLFEAAAAACERIDPTGAASCPKP